MCPRRTWWVTESKAVTSTASPTAPPSCWETLTRPEAAPASSGATSASEAEVRLTNGRPMPPPISTIETTICAYGVSPGSAWPSARPDVTAAAPIIITTFCGSLGTRTRLVSCEERNTEAGMGRKATPATQRREALDVLEELGEEEEHPVHAGVEQAPGHVGRAAGGVGQQPQGQDRLLGPALVVHEERQQDDADDERDDGQRAVQPCCPRLHQAEDDRRSCRRSTSPPRRSRTGRGRRGVSAITTRPTQPHGDPDGHVHEHHPAPRDELGQEPAGDEPGGATGRRHRGVEARWPAPGPGPRRRWR